MSEPNRAEKPIPESEVIIQEVRYSLPEMLRELQLERNESYFSKEIIDQMEINKIFDQQKKARAKRRKS